jgi:predicted phosphodiesterase
LFNKYGVDIAISGHTHQYCVYPPGAGEHNDPIFIGGGPADGKRTLIKVKADHRRLQLIMLDDSQKQVGEYLLTNKA